MKKVLLAIVAGLVLAGLAVYALRPVDGGRVTEDNPLLGPKTTTVAVAEVLDGIRGMNRLIVFRSYLTAVTKSRETAIFGQLGADQLMITPAFVNYYIDLDKITAKDIRVEGDTVRITLPPVMIERPNVDVPRIEVVDQGAWSSLSDASKRLWKKNSAMAMKQLFQRANMTFLQNAARKQALDAMLRNARLLVNRSGGKTYKVVVGF